MKQKKYIVRVSDVMRTLRTMPEYNEWTASETDRRTLGELIAEVFDYVEISYIDFHPTMVIYADDATITALMMANPTWFE